MVFSSRHARRGREDKPDRLAFHQTVLSPHRGQIPRSFVHGRFAQPFRQIKFDLKVHLIGHFIERCVVRGTRDAAAKTCQIGWHFIGRFYLRIAAKY